LWVGTALFLALILAANLFVSLVFANRIFPGVSMKGISLSGMNQEQAAVSIAASYTFPQSGQIMLTDGTRTWVVKPADLGFFLDPQASARAAFQTGRSGSILEILANRFTLLTQGKMDVSPTFIYNEIVALNYLNGLASQINQPLREASISISGTEVVVTNGQIGRVLDVRASLASIARQIELMQDGVVPLSIIESAPTVLDATAEGDLVRTILSQPLKLTLPAELSSQSGSWEIQPDALAKMLTFERVSNGEQASLQVVVSRPLMHAFLESIREKTDAVPENARFIFNDDTRQLDLLTPAVIGRTLNIQASIDSINQSVKTGAHSAALVFDLTQPAVTDKMTGAELGITELVYAYTTYFRGSSADRVQNIKAASASFHGLLVPPGGVLSMADELGDISLDNGYAEALIILGDQTIKGIGGGVCQVSTALFRTAYYAGYEILERHAHAYRVGYYEQTASGHNPNLAGLDATVFVPLVDFKFRNDTDYWLLMETYVNTSNSSLTWKFYSTSDGRVVNSETSGLTNIVESPEPLYRENPELPSGTVKQVDYAVEGADVVVRRTVTRNGSILHQDTFSTHYDAWRDIYEYGPGTEGMPPKE
nr:VanW family protein [Anaerolineaceae bacterium]